MKQSSARMKLSVLRLLVISTCIARILKHVNNAPHRFSDDLLTVTKSGPNRSTPTYVKGLQKDVVPALGRVDIIGENATVLFLHH